LGRGIHAELASALEEHLTAYLDNRAPEFIRGINAVLAGQTAVCTKGSDDNRIDEALRLIESNYSEQVRQSEVARAVGLSQGEFCRRFRQHTSQSFSSYMNRLRIEKAMSMLLLDDESIKGVAYSCGFSCNAYFSTVFKKVNGISPSEWKHLSPAPRSSFGNRQSEAGVFAP